MTAYSVYMAFSVSQVIKVEAGSIAQAIDLAWQRVDKPNISNKFEMDGDIEPIAVTDLDTGEDVWVEGQELPGDYDD